MFRYVYEPILQDFGLGSEAQAALCRLDMNTTTNIDNDNNIPLSASPRSSSSSSSSL